MQMWHLPAIFAPDFLLTFFGNSKFMQIHFFCSSHFRWYWRIYSLVPKKKLLLPVVSRMSGVYREFWAKIMEITIRKLTVHLTIGRTRKSYPHRGTRRAGVDGTPLLGFWYVAIFRNDFAFIGKPLIFSSRWGIFYGWWLCLRSVTSPNMVIVLVTILDFIKS